MLEEANKEGAKHIVAGFDLREMIKAGVHFGHGKSKLHPQMKPYVFGLRKTIYIIDLEKTALKLKEALDFIAQLAKENKKILFVGTKIQHQKIVKELAEVAVPSLDALLVESPVQFIANPVKGLGSGVAV